MLPGIRFLFAAVLLAVSLMVFGLGAAALLRSAHEEFASLPTRPIPPAAIFAQQQVEAPPTLSMLRVDAPAPDAVVPQAAVERMPVAAAETTETPDEKIAQPDEHAALVTTPTADSPAPVEAAKPEDGTAAAPEPVQTAAIAPTAAAAITAAAAPDMQAAPPPAADTKAETATAQPSATLTEDDAKLTSTDVAMLGEPPRDMVGQVPLPVARPTPVPVRKAAKRPAKKRRRVAALAPPIAAAAVQPTDPFGQPLRR